MRALILLLLLTSTALPALAETDMKVTQRTPNLDLTIKLRPAAPGEPIVIPAAGPAAPVRPVPEGVLPKALDYSVQIRMRRAQAVEEVAVTEPVADPCLSWGGWQTKVIHLEWTSAFPEDPPGAWEPWIQELRDGSVFRGNDDGTWLFINSTWDQASFRSVDNGALFAYLPEFTRGTSGNVNSTYMPALNTTTGTWVALPLFAVQNDIKVFRSTDGGYQFTEVDLSSVDGFDRPRAEDLREVNGRLIAASLAGLYTSIDDGVTWTNMPYGGLDPSYWGGPSSLGVFGDVVVAGWYNSVGPGILRSTDGGATWDMIEPADGDENLISPSIMVRDDGLMVAISGAWGHYDSVLRSTDLGLTWERVPLPEGTMQDVPLGGAWVPRACRFYIPTRDGSGDILSSADGLEWEREPTPEVVVGGGLIRDGWTGNITATGNTMAFATQSYVIMRYLAQGEE